MEIIRHTSLGRMVPCRSAQCNHSYCVSCSTAVLLILVVLIALLTPTVVGEGEVGSGERMGGLWTCAYVCMDGYVCVYAHICLCMRACMCVCVCVCIHACVHLCAFVHDYRVCECMCHWVCGCV